MIDCEGKLNREELAMYAIVSMPFADGHQPTSDTYDNLRELLEDLMADAAYAAAGTLQIRDFPYLLKIICIRPFWLYS